jgi:inhibitor of KinA
LLVLGGCGLNRPLARQASSLIERARPAAINCTRNDHCAIESPYQALAIAARAANTPDAPVHYVNLLERGEDALLLHFGDRIDAVINARVHAAHNRIQHALPQLETVPAYASILLRFDPFAWSDHAGQTPHQAVTQAVLHALQRTEHNLASPRRIEIPVYYDGEDLAALAQYAQLTIEQVITRHTGGDYQVAMLGFAPGFAYLLGLDPALAMPRRAEPRLRVPAGSVAIGGHQTGIYPKSLPGGWQLIGRTPLRLFDPTAASPSVLRAGDRVNFRAIDAAEFAHSGGDEP